MYIQKNAHEDMRIRRNEQTKQYNNEKMLDEDMNRRKNYKRKKLKKRNFQHTK